MNLITNRTQADVDRAKELNAKGKANMTAAELAEWSAGLKGAYNYTDLNRVETAVETLAEILGITLETKKDWGEKDIPTNADMERYLGNVRLLKQKYADLSTTPNPPSSMARLTYRGANDIEQILADIETILKTWYRGGEIYCGEV